jgi:transketolase
MTIEETAHGETAVEERRPAADASNEALRLQKTGIDTLRTLAMDAVQKANSGHPGAPMALAPVGYTLWRDHLRYDPEQPLWPNRDRFVLSNGHASMLLYGILHLAGVVEVDRHNRPTGAPAVSLDDIKGFRQLSTKCPGHPEHGMTTGVETTTGPLGQGCGNSVGMAMGSKWLGKTYNRPGFTLFDFDVFTICGDGDMMEGVASEAASLAGHLELDNLCWIYDSNRITIEGHTDLAFSDDVEARFKAYNWNVIRVGDANDTERFSAAVAKFKADRGAPTLIIVESRIGWGAPHKENTKAAHGEPLGVEEIRLAKRRYGWPEDESFLVPEDAKAFFEAGLLARGGALQAAWAELLAGYRDAHKDLAAQLDQMWAHKAPKGWDADLPSFEPDKKGLASRESSGKVLNALARNYPWLLGGAADLAPSTKTNLTFEGALSFSAETFGGRNLHFGIREHAMGAVVNGLALCDLRPFGSGFLIFSDYMKPPIRLSALMELPTIFIFTHDSIGVGEDGPTHQPVEQLLALRSVPGLITLRPADANEVVEAWRLVAALTREPACLILSRQNLPTYDRNLFAPASGLHRGAYVMADAKPDAVELILIGTGSEVALCAQVYEALAADGVGVRLVSMPSFELFERQDQAYRDSVLPKHVHARVSVEAGSVIGWDRYVGPFGEAIGMKTLGSSAPIADLMKKFGFTPDKVKETALRVLSAARAATQ